MKNEDAMRKLVRCSCDVMSKRYGKKVEVSSDPPPADCRVHQFHQDKEGELRVET